MGRRCWADGGAAEAIAHGSQGDAEAAEVPRDASNGDEAGADDAGRDSDQTDDGAEGGGDGTEETWLVLDTDAPAGVCGDVEGVEEACQWTRDLATLLDPHAPVWRERYPAWGEPRGCVGDDGRQERQRRFLAATQPHSVLGAVAHTPARSTL